MTSMINDLLPSAPPEQIYQVAKSESPPSWEVENSPFKESLEKAMAGEESAKAESVSVEREKTGEIQKDAKAKEKVSGKKGKADSGKLRSVGEGKSVDSLVKRSAENGESKIEADSLHLNLLQSGESKKISAEDRKSDELGRDSVSGKAGGRKKSENDDFSKADTSDLSSSATQIPGEMTERDEFSLKMTAEERNGESTNEPVVIPFPGNNGETANAVSEEAASQIADNGSALKAKGPVSGKKTAKEEPVLTVVDTRSKGAENRESAQAVTKTAGLTETVDQTGRESSQIILGEQNAAASGDEAKSFESRFAENREVVLARELRESGNDQIVKKASFILKDSNQGEIKLILKPEALGRVKIHLSMNENNLVGKIIVENNRVGQIFENNLNNLSKAFEEAGISSSSLEVSVGDGNNQRDGGNQSFQKDQPFFSERLKTFDKAVPTLERAVSGQGSQLINLVV